MRKANYFYPINSDIVTIFCNPGTRLRINIQVASAYAKSIIMLNTLHFYIDNQFPIMNYYMPAWVYLLVASLLFCINSSAQMPVSLEPHHKIILQNNYVRVLKGLIPGNDTTAAHVHAANSVIVFMSASRYGIEVMGERPVVTNVIPGDTKYVTYGDKHVTHRVWNLGLSTFDFLVVELLKHDSGKSSCQILSQPDMSVNFQQQLVTSYHVDITKEIPFKKPQTSCAFLLIDIAGNVTVSQAGANRSCQAGGVVFFPAQTDIEINTSSNANASCVLLQLK